MDSILLVENKYLYDEHNISKWGIPKGIINCNESFYDCARREVYEETGLKINISRKNPYLKLNKTYYFPIRAQFKNLNFKPIDKKEIKDVCLINIKDIYKYVRYNKDLKLLMCKYINRAKNIASLSDTMYL